MNPQQTQMEEVIKQQFAKLPRVVQDAITSADVQKRLRELADRHKLHLDQWENLENEVLLTLLGLRRSEELEENVQKELGMTAEEAAPLARDIVDLIFEPIRQELERQLQHPDAVEKGQSEIEALRESELQKHRDSELARAEAEGALPPPPKAPNPATVTEAAQAIATAEPMAAPASAPTPPSAAAPAVPSTAAAPAEKSAQTPTPAPIADAAPQVVREQISQSYKPGIPSTERKEVHDDPYREPPV